MNEPTVAFTLLALLLASALCLLVGFTAGSIVTQIRYKNNLRLTPSEPATDNLALDEQNDDAQEIVLDDGLSSNRHMVSPIVVDKLVKKKVFQDKLIKSILKYNLQLKKTWRSSTSDLDLAQRRLALQQLATSKLKDQYKVAVTEIDNLKARSIATSDLETGATNASDPAVIKDELKGLSATGNPKTQMGVSSVANRKTSNDAQIASFGKQTCENAIAPKKLQKTVRDDLTRIKGIGPKISRSLHDIGITSFVQIAELNQNEAQEIYTKLGRHCSMRKFNWVKQAIEFENEKQKESAAEAVAA